MKQISKLFVLICLISSIFICISTEPSAQEAKSKPTPPKVSTVDDKDKVIKAKVAKGSTVKIVIGGHTYKVKCSGTQMKLKLNKSYEAGTRIKATAITSSGTSKTSVVYVIPATPVVSKPEAYSEYVYGKATKKSTVYVHYKGKAYKSKASGNGTFKVKVPKLKNKSVVKVRSYAGKQYSKYRTMKVRRGFNV